MLVLSRKEGEKIVVTIPPGWSGSFTLEVVQFRRGGADTVRLAFDAPKEVEIMREELTYKPQGGK